MTRTFQIRNLVESQGVRSTVDRRSSDGIPNADVFHSSIHQPGTGGEIQLTDGLKHLLHRVSHGTASEERADAGDLASSRSLEMALRRGI